MCRRIAVAVNEERGDSSGFLGGLWGNENPQKSFDNSAKGGASGRSQWQDEKGDLSKNGSGFFKGFFNRKKKSADLDVSEEYEHDGIVGAVSKVSSRLTIGYLLAILFMISMFQQMGLVKVLPSAGTVLEWTGVKRIRGVLLSGPFRLSLTLYMINNITDQIHYQNVKSSS